MLRTVLFDRWVAGFLTAHPDGTVVEIGGGDRGEECGKGVPRGPAPGRRTAGHPGDEPTKGNAVHAGKSA
ncbi:hypothetical protein GCM10010279_30620 [Streptomyces mutabilis]|nr:hypothetical protein GCM10010279_30620 [Streptomyces mutabilis]